MNKIRGSQPMRTKHQTIVSGVLILTISNIIVKIIGLLFKIPISYILTDIGMGYFNAAYTIYAWLYMISTAGVPVAVSSMIAGALAAGDYSYARQIRKTAGKLLLCVGAAFSVFLILFSSRLSKAIGTYDARFCMIAIAPTLLFVSVQSVIRGHFQGHRQMTPTAISQLLESFGKLMPGVALAGYAAKKGLGYPMIAAYGIIGVSIGALGGMIYLMIQERRWLARENSIAVLSDTPSQRVLSSFLRIVIPITLSSSVMSLTSLIDLGMIMRRLQSAGFHVEDATALYGNYSTLVVPLFNLPSILVYPIAAAIIPEISALRSSNMRREANQAIKTTLKLSSMISVPCALGIGIFAYPILSLIFRDRSASIAAPLLSILAPGIFFLCILAVTNSILQASDHSFLPMVSMMIGSIVKLTVGYILIGLPDVGMKGAPISTVSFYISASMLNLIFVMKTNGNVISIDTFLVRPLCSGLCAVLSGALLYHLTVNTLGQPISLLTAILLSVIVYLSLALFLGMLNQYELSKIPLIKRLCRSNQ